MTTSDLDIKLNFNIAFPMSLFELLILFKQSKSVEQVKYHVININTLE